MVCTASTKSCIRDLAGFECVSAFWLEESFGVRTILLGFECPSSRMPDQEQAADVCNDNHKPGNESHVSATDAPWISLRHFGQTESNPLNPNRQAQGTQLSTTAVPKIVLAFQASDGWLIMYYIVRRGLHEA